MDILALLISFLVAVAIFGLFLGLFSGVGAGVDRQNERIRDIRNEKEKSIADDVKKEKVKVSEAIKRKKEENRKKVAKRNRQKEKENKHSTVDDMLAIVQWDITSEQFLVIKLVCALVGVILSMIICMRLHVGVNKFVLAMIFCGLVGMLIPGEILKGKSKKYQESIRLDLPDVMDLLVVSVEAGLAFDAALMRLYERNKTVVMEQLIQATRDIQRGVSKREAYLDLAQRCKVKELTTFLIAMIQADQLGTSIQTVLRSQAEVLRNERKRTAARKAKEAPVKMLIPMVLFVFPVIFIVLLGPAALNIMDILG